VDVYLPDNEKNYGKWSDRKKESSKALFLNGYVFVKKRNQLWK